MNSSPLLSDENKRIDIADVLRGIAVMGILVLHCIEHFNFYSFPQTESALLKFTDQVTWDSLFFLFGGKMYAVFALLFGFSFFIQNDNQERKGNDFRLRFAWRLVLLFLIGNLNAAFFSGEVLVLYSLVGFILIPASRLSNKALLGLAIFFFIQPLELIKATYVLLHPEHVWPASLSGIYFQMLGPAQMGDSLLQLIKTNLWEGQIASLTWAWDNGRVTQTASLFLFGLLIGRRKLLLGKEENLLFWFKAMLIALFGFFSLRGLQSMMPEFITNGALLAPLAIMVRMWANFAFMVFLLSSILLLFYKTKLQATFRAVIPYGKMSLTNYLMQSVVGGFIFYGWGIGAYAYLGHTFSFLTGIVLVVLQLFFCRWWLASHKQGPFEYMWKKATWVAFPFFRQGSIIGD